MMINKRNKDEILKTRIKTGICKVIIKRKSYILHNNYWKDWQLTGTYIYLYANVSGTYIYLQQLVISLIYNYRSVFTHNLSLKCFFICLVMEKNSGHRNIQLQYGW